MYSKNDLWIKFIKANQKTMNFIFHRKDYLCDSAILSKTAYFRQLNRDLISDLYRFYRTDHLANG